MGPLDDASRLLRKAIDRRVFPGSSVDVGSSRGSLWHETRGALAFGDEEPPVTGSTLYDLASLTKPIATTTVVMDLERAGDVELDEPVARAFPEWRGPDREAVTVRDLLEHASGLPPRLLDPHPAGAREFEHDICRTPLEAPPRTRAIYSDLGFILLGLLAAKRRSGGLAGALGTILRGLAAAEPDLAVEPLAFRLERPVARLAAPTLPEPDDERRGRRLVGEVHDPYALALGGVAGHAGLFGTAAGVAAFARVVLRAARGEAMPEPVAPPRLARFLEPSRVPSSTRALGWDTMRATSSCGSHMSGAAIGHVGFTGTSLWIDPERDRYFVLLTNRACGGGTLDEMRSVRRAFHDALGSL